MATRASYCSGLAAASMSTGLASSGSAGSNARSAVRVAGAELGQLQTVRLAGVGEQDAGAAGVGHDADAPPGGTGCADEQGGDVEQLLQRVGADDAGLLEQRVDRDVEAGQRRGMARCGARAGGERPDLTATIGFRRATSGATRANLRGLPKLSR